MAVGQDPRGECDQGAVRARPGDAVLTGDLGHRPVPRGAGLRGGLPQPGRGARPSWDLRRGLRESSSRAIGFTADEAALAPPHFDLSSAGARSFTATVGRSLTCAVSTPQAGQAASLAGRSITTRTVSSVSRSTLETTNSSSSPNSTDVVPIMLVALLLRW